MSKATAYRRKLWKRYVDCGELRYGRDTRCVDARAARLDLCACRAPFFVDLSRGPRAAVLLPRESALAFRPRTPRETARDGHRAPQSSACRQEEAPGAVLFGTPQSPGGCYGHGGPAPRG